MSKKYCIFCEHFNYSHSEDRRGCTYPLGIETRDTPTAPVLTVEFSKRAQIKNEHNDCRDYSPRILPRKGWSAITDLYPYIQIPEECVKKKRRWSNWAIFSIFVSLYLLVYILDGIATTLSR